MDTSLLAQLTGTTEAHLQVWADGVKLHRQMIAPWEQLRAAGQKAGFDLQIASGFRSFERQKTIWQAKACGARALFDEHGGAVSFEQLSANELLHCLLRWSALPGVSRHHWGTDVDIFDAATLPPSYKLQLVPQEYDTGGPFADMSEWLSERIKDGESFGFYRPYAEDCGGVAVEPWHLSYQPLAVIYQSALSLPQLRSWLEQQDWRLADIALEQCDDIYARYLAVVDSGVGQPALVE